jgi:hypothetical protein
LILPVLPVAATMVAVAVPVIPVASAMLSAAIAVAIVADALMVASQGFLHPSTGGFLIPLGVFKTQIDIAERFFDAFVRGRRRGRGR